MLLIDNVSQPMPYEPLHHKYRPKSFSQLVGQEAIATTLTNAIRTAKIAPAYLFTGPRGTGKTSSARILAKSLNCLKTNHPTAEPCGVCDVCLGIANGSTLDVIEIDAASNTGVDNIREIIERAQFAPVQCRYKVYVVDECLTGDSLVLTSEGQLRIDDPSIKGKQVLSYNDSTGEWEYKKVLRWLERGERQTLVIKTTNREIRCTGNHLIRTDRGWIPARDVKEGVKILSPANVDAASSFTNSALMDVSEGLLADTSLKAIPTGTNPTIGKPSLNKRKHSDLSVLAGVEKSLMSPPFYNKKAKALKASCLAGEITLTRKDTVSGRREQKNSSLRLNFSQQKPLGLSTAPYWEIVPSLTQINTVDSPDWLSDTEKSSESGWNIKPITWKHCDQNCSLRLTQDTVPEIWRSIATQPVTPNSKMYLTSLNQMGIGKLSLCSGYSELPQKDLLGGTWMMGHSVSIQKELQQLSFIQKDFPPKTTKPLPIGLQQLATQQKGFIAETTETRLTTTSAWERIPVENSCQTLKNILSPQWITSLECVESVTLGEVEKVYDLEVADNHNFVANGLCLHNCHMLSTAAFNALLKTLEEPPKHVVFVLATTDPQRVLPTIISRCQRFDFRRIPLEAMVGHLITIARNENINITPEAITLVAQLSQGGLRDAESLLDQLSLLSGDVTPDRVWDLVGSVSEKDLLALVRAIASNSAEATLDSTRQILDRGREPLTVLQNLAAFYRDLLIAKTAPTRGDLVACTQETWQAMCQLIQPWDMSLILAAQQHLRSCEVQVKNTTQPRLWLEVVLLGLLPSAIAPPVVTAASKVVSPIPNPTPVPATEVRPPTATPSPQTPPPQLENSAPTPPITSSPQPAISEPAPATPVPQPQPLASSQEFDLPTVWQQVLAYIEVPSTRGILGTMCYLVEFDGNVALLGIKGKWMTRVQTELPKIHAAFQRCFQRQITVKLQADNSSPPPPRKTPVPPQNPTHQPPRNPPLANYNSGYNGANYKNSNNNIVPTSSANTPAKTEPPKTVPQAVQTTQPQQSPTTTIDSSQDDEVAIAAQRLAEFFRGEVVRFADEPGLRESTEVVEWEEEID